MELLSPSFTSSKTFDNFASAKRYTMVIISEGENYGLSDTPRIIQSPILPYVFNDRGPLNLILAMSIIDKSSSMIGLAIYNTTDKEALKRLYDKDRACGIPGDHL